MQKMVEPERAQNAHACRRLHRGYDTNHLSEEVRRQLKGLEATSLFASIFDATVYYAWIAAIAGATVLVWQVNAVAGALAYIFAVIVIARQQRGFELMIHDASHGSWERQNRTVNHRAADLVVGLPMMSTVSAYWASHRVHHGTYGGHLDPCRRRFADMGLGHIDLSTRAQIMSAVLRWLIPYNIAYYKEIGSKSRYVVGAWATWHVAVAIMPMAYFLGMPTAICLWGLFWLVPMMLTLPIVRSIAEAEEHDYSRGETEFTTTFTNIGLMHRLLWHPWNDGYHQIHHMFPNISERHHAKVHRLLVENDPKYRESLFRTKTLEQFPLSAQKQS